jgi:hypothetical protein
MTTTRRFFLTMALAALAGVTAIAGFNRSRPAKAAPSSRQPVIVELFTSEGCSSCPPADALLKKLSEEQPVSGAEVIALEQHVDYWNRLGWADPFSSPDISERQQGYASLFGNESVYTPQMVVDGATEFPGGRAKQAQQTIQQASERPKAGVRLSEDAVNGDQKIIVRIEAEHLSSVLQQGAGEVWVAVTEKGLHSQVTAGENSGELLQHAAIVRSTQKVAKTQGADSYRNAVTIELHQNWKRENLAVVVFLVQERSRRIVGAASLPVS